LKSLVVDTSVAIKWLVDEPGSDAARRLLAEENLHAPDCLLLEIANTLWLKQGRHSITREQAEAFYSIVNDLPIALTPMTELLGRARTLAFAMELTVYDAVFVALAERLACPLATADQGIIRAMERAASRHGVVAIQ